MPWYRVESEEGRGDSALRSPRQNGADTRQARIQTQPKGGGGPSKIFVAVPKTTRVAGLRAGAATAGRRRLRVVWRGYRAPAASLSTGPLLGWVKRVARRDDKLLLRRKLNG